MFRNLMQKLASFMYGRYGNDKLNKYLLAVGFILLIINFFVGKLPLLLISFAFLIAYYFRSFSKNIYKRQSENRKFSKFIAPFENFFIYTFRRLKDIKTARYRTCKNCHARIKLPIKKGTHTVKCPKCGNRFKTHILF